MAKTNNFSTPTQLLGSLAHELKNPLTLIARKAELEALSVGNSTFSELQATAEDTLKLIDSYLLMAQSEYGQVRLPLEAVGVGSVVYDVLQELSPLAEKNNISLNANVHDMTAMTNKQGLKTALWCLLRLVIDFVPQENISKRPEILINTKTSKMDFVNISVFGNHFDIDKKDIIRARSMQGNSRLALCLKNEGSGIQLAIADTLAMSLGDGLSLSKNDGMRGFTLKLRKSHQLQLI